MEGPVRDIAVPVDYFDVTMPERSKFIHTIQNGRNAFAYVFRGGISSHGSPARTGQLAIVPGGEEITLEADEGGARFLLASGVPIQEPVAWGGPIVMNTEEELEEASLELRKGSFVR